MAAAAAAAANGTGGSSGMEVDAAGNWPHGNGFWRLPSGCIRAAFLDPGRSQEGGRNIAPWDNLQEGCIGRALPSPGRDVGPGLSPAVLFVNP